MTKTLFLALFLAFAAFGRSHIVLFKQADIAVSSLEHGAFQSLLQSSNQKSVEQLKQWLGGDRSHSVKDLWLIRGSQLELGAEEAKKLSREPWVAGVYVDQVRRFVPEMGSIKTRTLFRDDEMSLWGLERIGLKKIQAEFPEIQGTGVRVGILDTGIQAKHDEFIRPGSNGRVNSLVLKYQDFVNHITSSAYDDHGHGTHVAGTIGGLNVGIAPNVNLTVGKVFTAQGFGTDSVILSAMQWMFDPDGNSETNDYPQVISNSWGAGLINSVVHDINAYQPYRLAIQVWIQGGIIPVFAAGNSGSEPNGIPAGLPEALAVGAIEKGDSIASFSSRGPNVWLIGEAVLTVLKPDVSAPGVAVTSAFPGNKYATWSGTSMATPHVTGSIALALQANPKLKFSDVKELLLKTSEKKVDISFGYGLLNAYELVKAAKTRAAFLTKN